MPSEESSCPVTSHVVHEAFSPPSGAAPPRAAMREPGNCLVGWTPWGWTLPSECKHANITATQSPLPGQGSPLGLRSSPAWGWGWGTGAEGLGLKGWCWEAGGLGAAPCGPEAPGEASAILHVAPGRNGQTGGPRTWALSTKTVHLPKRERSQRGCRLRQVRTSGPILPWECTRPPPQPTL